VKQFLAKSQSRKKIINTIDDALKVLDDNSVTIISGGTDLMVQKAVGTGIKPDFKRPLLFIGHLDELKRFN